MAINAVLLAVVIMLGLSLARVHVVLSLLIGALAGGLIAGLGMTDTLNAFQEGIRNGALARTCRPKRADHRCPQGA